MLEARSLQLHKPYTNHTHTHTEGKSNKPTYTNKPLTKQIKENKTTQYPKRRPPQYSVKKS